jgi:tetratricopeptide (TPR) repeat protein
MSDRVGGAFPGDERTGRPPRPGARPGAAGAGYGAGYRTGRPSGPGGPRPSADRGWDRDRDREGSRGDFRDRRGSASDAPRIPDSITEDQLSKEVKEELRGLPADLANYVGRYLVAAELASDPEQAYRYAQAARERAARIGVVREVSGMTAYQTGRWAEALAELRAARRLTGRGDYLPLMADSERALGRLDRALELVHSDEAKRLPRAAQIELRIVESGIRRDQGLSDAAVLALQVPELTDGKLRPWSARLFYAYGDALLAAGRPEAAREAFSRAVVADEDEQTDALSRLDQLDGITVEDLEADDEEESELLDDEAFDDEEDDFDDEDDLDDESEDDLEDEDDEDLEDENDDDLEDEDDEEDEEDPEDVDDSLSGEGEGEGGAAANAPDDAKQENPAD